METIPQRKNENSNKMEEDTGKNSSRIFELLIIFSIAFTLFYSVFCIKVLQTQVEVLAIAHNKLLNDFDTLKKSCNYHLSNSLRKKNDLDPQELVKFLNNEAVYPLRLHKREIFSKGEKTLKQLTEDSRLVKEQEDLKENNTVVSAIEPSFDVENKTESSVENHHSKSRGSLLTPIKISPRPVTNSGHHGRKVNKEKPLQKKFSAALTNERSEQRHRGHAENSFKPVAVHYSASLSNHSLRHHPLHKGNGLVTLPSPLYQYWIPTPWFEDLNVTDGFSLEGSDFKVSKRGIYFLYSQIQYTTKKDHNGYKVYKNSEPIAQCIFTKTLDHPEPSVQTCSLTTVVSLSPNDKIFIQDISHNPTVALSPEKSFFGLVLIAQI